jgi:enolase
MTSMMSHKADTIAATNNTCIYGLIYESAENTPLGFNFNNIGTISSTTAAAQTEREAKHNTMILEC